MIGQLCAYDENGAALNAHFDVLSSNAGSGTTLNVTCRFDRASRVSYISAHIDEVTVTAMLEHGFQSWSTVRRCSPGDVRVERAESPRWFRAQVLADRSSA